MKSREFGKVAKVRDAYAFITPDADGKDIFAHATELPSETIHSGVSYIEAADHSRPGKMLARDVQFINGGDSQ